MKTLDRAARGEEIELARVLLADGDPASRLTLQTVLEASGYRVDSAASAAEAVGMLDEREYELVLSHLQMESPESGLKVLAHARMMDYKPATGILTSYHKPSTSKDQQVLIRPVDVPGILGKVAGLIGTRAARRMQRELRHANGMTASRAS